MRATQQTEQKLTEEAQILIQTLKKSIADGDALYDLVQTNHTTEVERKRETQKMQEETTKIAEKTMTDLSQFSKESEQILQGIEQITKEDFNIEKR